jgi:hypothetical protein
MTVDGVGAGAGGAKAGFLRESRSRGLYSVVSVADAAREVEVLMRPEHNCYDLH